MIEVEEQQELGRAKNAIQDYLIRQLLVPKVYLDAAWCGEHVDVLAVDRAGVGDVHAVRIASSNLHFTPPQPSHGATMVSSTSEFDRSLRSLKNIPSHFRYVAVLVPDSRSKDYYPASTLLQRTLAEDGVGRIGILFVDLGGSVPAIHAVVRPERYRSTPQLVEIADQFVAANQANWEVRE